MYRVRMVGLSLMNEQSFERYLCEFYYIRVERVKIMVFGSRILCENIITGQYNS